MKAEKFEGTISSFWDQKIEPTLNFAGEYQAFESTEEMRKLGEYPNESAILKMVNDKRKASARQSEMVKVVTEAGYIKPTLENSVQLQLKSLIKVYVAAGKSEEEAQQIAETTLGAKLDEE